MKVTKTCILTLVKNTLDLDITPQQLLRINDRHKTDEYIQDIVPHLTPDEREFLMTGILPKTWDDRLSPRGEYEDLNSDINEILNPERND